MYKLTITIKYSCFGPGGKFKGVLVNSHQDGSKRWNPWDLDNRSKRNRGRSPENVKKGNFCGVTEYTICQGKTVNHSTPTVSKTIFAY